MKKFYSLFAVLLIVLSLNSFAAEIYRCETGAADRTVKKIYIESYPRDMHAFVLGYSSLHCDGFNIHIKGVGPGFYFGAKNQGILNVICPFGELEEGTYLGSFTSVSIGAGNSLGAFGKGKHSCFIAGITMKSIGIASKMGAIFIVD